MPEDPGVAVYFDLEGRERCFPVDRWYHVEDNVRAIGLAIAALRGLDRWGAKHMVDAAFAGFAALPATVSNGEVWWEVLGVSRNATLPEIETAYRLRVKAMHPDVGGDPEQFHALQNAYRQAKDPKGVTA